MRAHSISSPGGQGLFVLALPLALLAIVLVPWLAGEIAHGRYTYFIVGALFAFQFVVSLRWWRLSVYSFYIYVMIEGFVVNYFEGRAEINLIKDMQMIVIFLSLAAVTIIRHIFPFPPVRWLPLFVGFALIYTGAVFNPNLPTILVGLVGVRVTLLFFLCFAIGYWFFRNRDDVIRFFRFQALLSIPICLFGILQYFTGPALLLSISPGFNRAIFYVYSQGDHAAGSFFRTISTFASTSGFAQYLWVTFVLTLAYLWVVSHKAERQLAIVLMVIQACALLTTGSRGVVVFTFLSILLSYAFLQRLQRGLAVASYTALLLLAGTFLLGEGVQSRFATLLDVNVVVERNRDVGYGNFSTSMDAPAEGLGAGRLSAASYRLRPDMPLMGVESQLAKVRLEAGLPGLVIFALCVFMMLIDVTRTALRIRTPALRVAGSAAASITATIILTLGVGMPLDVPPTNFLFWFLLGLVYAIDRIEKAESCAAFGAPSARAAVPGQVHATP